MVPLYALAVANTTFLLVTELQIVTRLSGRLRFRLAICDCKLDFEVVLGFVMLSAFLLWGRPNPIPVWEPFTDQEINHACQEVVDI
jgi:hypothetical protein